jgi:hypothetical protein
MERIQELGDRIQEAEFRRQFRPSFWLLASGFWLLASGF